MSHIILFYRGINQAGFLPFILILPNTACYKDTVSLLLVESLVVLICACGVAGGGDGPGVILVMGVASVWSPGSNGWRLSSRSSRV